MISAFLGINAATDPNRPRIAATPVIASVDERGKITALNLPEPHQSWRAMYGRFSDKRTACYLVDAEEWECMTQAASSEEQES